MIRLPKRWWDIILDGTAYKLALSQTPYRNLTALRSAVYREAENRLTNVATHKDGPMLLVVQAWGTGGREKFPPTLAAITTVLAAPTLEAGPQPIRAYVCDCGQGPNIHSLQCSIWAGAQELDPAPQEQPPTPTVDHFVHDLPTTPSGSLVTDDVLTEADIEALLGPCTCGQAPTCLPSCARAGG